MLDKPNFITLTSDILIVDDEKPARERLRQLIREDPSLGSSLMTELVKVTAHRLRGARAQLARAGIKDG